MEEYRDFVLDGYIYVYKRNEDCYRLAKKSDGTDPFNVPRNAETYSFDEVEKYYNDYPEMRYSMKTPEEDAKDRTLQYWKSLSADELKALMFSTETYRFVDDDMNKWYSDVPMCEVDNKVFTVDECKQMYMNYLGDDDERANEYLSVVREAKQYIRTAVDNFKSRLSTE